MLMSCARASCRARVWVVKIKSTLPQPRRYMHVSFTLRQFLEKGRLVLSW